MPYVTSTFATRMTPREQPRIELDVNARSRMSAEDSPTWLEYQRRHADELDEGRRAMERLAALAADSGDEPYTSTGLRPLLAGGQEPHAVRIDPKTRMCDNAVGAGKSRGATGQTSEAAGRGRQRIPHHNGSNGISSTIMVLHSHVEICHLITYFLWKTHLKKYMWNPFWLPCCCFL